MPFFGVNSSFNWIVVVHEELILASICKQRLQKKSDPLLLPAVSWHPKGLTQLILSCKVG